MVNVKFSSTLFMVSLSFLANMSQVVGTPFEIMWGSHDSMDKSDLRNRSLAYPVHFSDHQGLEQQEQLFKSEPVVYHLWRNVHNGRKLRSSHVTTQNSYGYPHASPLPNTSHNLSGDKHRRSIDSQKGYYRLESENESSGLANTIGRKTEKLVDYQAITSKLHNSNDVNVKTYFNCHKLGDPPIYQRAYYKIIPKVLTPQINAHDLSVKSVSTEEDIYQPRSQVIQYKFDSPFKLLRRVGKMNPSKQVRGRNFMDNVNDISNPYQHRRVKSDQRHKIRHHHGEWRRPSF